MAEDTTATVVVATPHKPGWKTTEFWVVAAVIVAALVPVMQELWTGLQPVFPTTWQPIAASIAAVGYALSRAFVKAIPAIIGAIKAPTGGNG